MMAAAGGHLDVVELLVEKGADVTAIDHVSVMPGSCASPLLPPHVRPLSFRMETLR